MEKMNINQMMTSNKEKWTKYIIEGKEDFEIRPEIIASWKRCRKYELDPYAGKGKQVSKSDFQRILKDNSKLLQVAKPIMKDLMNIVKSTSYAIVLTDSKGIIIETIWNNHGLDRRDELNFFNASIWTEKYVGTNAIGTALYLNQAIQTLGGEHYCNNQHEWTCSAAPIHDEDGNIIGIIDLSGDYTDFHQHSLGMVVAAASSISKQLQIMNHKKWVETAYELMQEGILIIDNKYKIKNYNKSFCEILNISSNEVIDLDIKLLLKDIVASKDIFSMKNRMEYYEVPIYLKKKRIECSVTVSPVIEGIKNLGAVISITKFEKIKSAVSRMIGYRSNYDFDDIITENPKMKDMIELARKIAKKDSTVLIQGESGTGKELFAHSIHRNSSRNSGPFVAVNCAALPKDLIESELFGYEKGAFTGALREGKSGKFELANHGSIFLDEIGEMPLEVQSKLLRVLDNKRITRIGGTYERSLDIRIIAATNRNLETEIQNKNFRSDLYYRLNTIKLELLGLNERPEDIILCANHFLKKLNEKYPDQVKNFDKSFINYLNKKKWKGNVRELQNEVERGFLFSDQDTIVSHTDDIIPKEKLRNNILETTLDNSSSFPTLDMVEKNLLIKALNETEGNVVNASKLVGIGKSTFYRKMKYYKIDDSHFGKKR